MFRCVSDVLEFWCAPRPPSGPARRARNRPPPAIGPGTPPCQIPGFPLLVKPEFAKKGGGGQKFLEKNRLKNVQKNRGGPWCTGASGSRIFFAFFRKNRVFGLFGIFRKCVKIQTPAETQFGGTFFGFLENFAKSPGISSSLWAGDENILQNWPKLSF